MSGMRPATSKPNGFTLVEMLVVLAIIIVLSGLILTGLALARKQASIGEMGVLLKSIETSVERYADDFGDFPHSKDTGEEEETGLEGAANLYAALMTRAKNGPYLSGSERSCDNGFGRECLADKWGRPIRYLHFRDYKGEPNRKTFRLMSDGPDGEHNPFGVQTDDIVNWDKEKYAAKE
jgi:prepilin-type N-terminal cleavage/methylation domain-containing protein